MLRMTVLIATRNRLEKLINTLESIPQIDWLDIVVVFDGDKENYDAMSDYRSDMKCYLVEKHSGSVYCRNYGISKIEENRNILYATDDITFPKRAFDKYLEEFNEAFPDDDGVMGIAQNNPHSPTGVALVGKKFIDRYPGRQLFDPKFYHFAAQEVHRLALKLDKFAYSESAATTHYSPNRNKKYMDQTHSDARKRKKEDFALMKKKEQEGSIWGL